MSNNEVIEVIDDSTILFREVRGAYFGMGPQGMTYRGNPYNPKRWGADFFYPAGDEADRALELFDEMFAQQLRVPAWADNAPPPKVGQKPVPVVMRVNDSGSPFHGGVRIRAFQKEFTDYGIGRHSITVFVYDKKGEPQQIDDLDSEAFQKLCYTGANCAIRVKYQVSTKTNNVYGNLVMLAMYGDGDHVSFGGPSAESMAADLGTYKRPKRVDPKMLDDDELEDELD